MKPLPPINFYDASAMLTLWNFYDGVTSLYHEKFVTSSYSLQILEQLASKKYHGAESLLNSLKQNRHKYIVRIFQPEMLNAFDPNKVFIDSNLYELATAYDYEKNERPDEMYFTTSKLSIYNIANLFFGEDSIFLI